MDYVTFRYLWCSRIKRCMHKKYLHGGLFEIFVIFPYIITNMAITNCNYDGWKSKGSNVNR